MGGAADLPQRSSSPLKRRASDLEAEVASSQNDDVDMIQVPPSNPMEATDNFAESSNVKRAQSVDMLKEENEPQAEISAASINGDASRKKSTGKPSPKDQPTRMLTMCRYRYTSYRSSDQDSHNDCQGRS
jgi:ubiquitin carboxyl-terminal hydrolase 4/11/15